MKVFKVYPTLMRHSDFPRTTTKRQAYYTNNAFDLNSAPAGALVLVSEMTEEQYKSIPAMEASYKFFRK
jgi:hypothetical protein